MIKKLAVLALVGATFSVEAAISVVGTEVAFGKDGTKNNAIKVPKDTQGGDLLVLAIHRTDDYLPIEIDQGWTRVAECFKTDNGNDCGREEDCSRKSDGGRYCERFGSGSSFGGGPDTGGTGHDLAEVIYVKKAACNERSSYSFSFKTKHNNKIKAGWFLMTALRGADTSDPVRDWASRGNDGSKDSLFPRVSGRAGDYLFLFQSYDDKIASSKFRAPQDMSTLGYTFGSDETGFTYGQLLASSDLDYNNMTSEKETQGDGSYAAKDALISMSIKPATSSPESCGNTNTNGGNTNTNGDNNNQACNSGSWKGLIRKCGDCFALVETDVAETCEEFCDIQGLGCESAAEDRGNKCTNPQRGSAINCQTNMKDTFRGTSDMLCTCKPRDSTDNNTAKTKTKCGTPQWGLKKECNDCFSLAYTSEEIPNCDQFCRKQGTTCVAAFEDVKDKCTGFLASGDITCNTNFKQRFQGTSDMLCWCDASTMRVGGQGAQPYTDSKEGNVFDEYTADVDSLDGAGSNDPDGISAAVLTTAGIVPLLATVAGHFIFC